MGAKRPRGHNPARRQLRPPLVLVLETAKRLVRAAKAEQQQSSSAVVALGERALPQSRRAVVKLQIQRMVDLYMCNLVGHPFGENRLEVAKLLGRRALGDPLTDQLIECCGRHRFRPLGDGYLSTKTAIFLGAHQARFLEGPQRLRTDTLVPNASRVRSR